MQHQLGKTYFWPQWIFYARLSSQSVLYKSPFCMLAAAPSWSHTTWERLPEPLSPHVNMGCLWFHKRVQKIPPPRKKCFPKVCLKGSRKKHVRSLKTALQKPATHNTRGGVVSAVFKFTIVISLSFRLLLYSAPCVRSLWGKRGSYMEHKLGKTYFCPQ